MRKFTFSGKRLSASLLFLALMSACGNPSPEVLPGVSLELARQRKAIISNINYRLWFGIPAAQDAAIAGRVKIEFDLGDAGTPLQLDFRESSDKILAVSVNGKASVFEFRNEHIVIPAVELIGGANSIEIEFVAGDTSLNRNPEYLYTLFVPDRARTAFPLFDQPDLKATYELSLALPGNWAAISYAGIERVEITNDRQHPQTLIFAKSEPISSYLFSFVAGKFEVANATAEMKDRQSEYAMTMLHRETDAEKVERNLAEIMRLHQSAIRWLTEYTGIEYPFSKLDCALIPAFQYGGMEHVGAIQYRASSLLLDENPSETELLGRASLIAHEVSHMWFGNLVTMQWFDDVWTKEVFANFMAAKIVNPSFPDVNHDLNFLVRHYPGAYGVDRSEGANPIRQDLLNLNEAGQMYGAIIYDKAPIMMRQLELIVGEEKFREGLQEYLSRFSYGNATWPDLVSILDTKTDGDLTTWSEVWVNTAGRPEFEARRENADAGAGRPVLLQHDNTGRGRVWPQRLGMLAVAGEEVHTLQLSSTSVATAIPVDFGASAMLMYGTAGTGYGLFPANLKDFDSWRLLDEVQKGAVLVNIHENVLAGHIGNLDEYFLALLDVVSKEDNQLLLSLALQQVSRTYVSLLTEVQRARYTAELEQILWARMLRQQDPSRMKIFFLAFAKHATSSEQVRKVYEIWSRELVVDKLTLSEDDYISLAETLAIRLPGEADNILEKQLALIKNPDSRRRLEFVAPSLSPSGEVRDEFFASLALEKNRQTESWVVDALQYLHHPSRTTQSEKYIPRSLELLQEIQVTGDVFFPTRWLVATLQNHNSSRAVGMIRAFLQTHPDYNSQLRMKILQAADMLFRANAIIAAGINNE